MIAPYGQVLTGNCTATFDNLVLGEGRIFSLTAKIGCRSGEIGTQLLASAMTNLGFQIAPGLLDQVDAPIAFTNLELDFQLTDGRLAFRSSNEHIVARDQAGQPMIGHAGDEDRSLDDLAMFLVQPDATDERLTAEMLDVLKHFHRPAPPLRTADRDVSQNY